jgi:hypothetical protein
LIICDYVHRDPGTGKATMLGCFSVIHAREFPARHPRLFVHTILTDGRGKLPVRLKIVDAEEELDPLFDQELEVELKDPRAVGELTFQIDNLTFPSPGEYRLQLFAGAEFLMERRVIVNQLPPLQPSPQVLSHE